MSPALVLVDVQYDFLPALPDHPEKGSLAVDNGDEILPWVRQLLNGEYKWSAIAVSQDYHPEGHISFASAHGLPPFSEKTMANPYSFGLEGNPRPETIQQTLWPDHCIIRHPGSEIEKSVKEALEPWENEEKVITIQKGSDKAFEAYSAFLSNPKLPPNQADLTKGLKERNIDTLFVVGLATDFCVRATAVDAKQAGFEVFVIGDAIRAVGGLEATEKVSREWQERGIEVITMKDPRLEKLLTLSES